MHAIGYFIFMYNAALSTNTLLCLVLKEFPFQNQLNQGLQYYQILIILLANVKTL